MRFRSSTMICVTFAVTEFFVKFCTVACIVLVVSRLCAEDKGVRVSRDMRPNILLAFSDDQSWLHTSFNSDPTTQTPNFDRIAREGVSFTHCFSACPSCTPSRSAVLTGQGIWRLKQAGVLYGSIPKDVALFPLLLEESGYHVGFTGKGWVPGDPVASGLERYPIGKEYNTASNRFVAKGINDQDYAANFRQFLKDRPDGAPFFFWFGCKEPHRVYEDGIGKRLGKKTRDVVLPDFFPDEEVVRSDILDYCVEIEYFDRQLGSMIEMLEAAGELDNTIVVVTSDNGMPFPRCKTTLYDWGVRMPLAIRWQKIPANRVIDDFVSLTDLAPTFLDATGLPVPSQMTGQSLLPVLTSSEQGRIETARDHVVTAIERHTWCRPHGATYPSRAIRTYEYLYIRNFEPERWPTGGPSFISSNKTFHGDVDECPTKSFMVTERNRFPQEYELCFGKRPLEELYAVRGDPGQTKNLANNHKFSDVKQSLWSRLQHKLRDSDDPRIEGRDPWKNYVYRQTIGFGAKFNASLTESERRIARERSAHKPE